MSSTKTLFCDNWKFFEFPFNTAYEEMTSSKNLYPVSVPHDWMIYHTKDLYKDSIGFYQKRFTISPNKSHSYILRFEGVYMNSKIYLNHEVIFEWKYGYSTFDVDLTPYIKEENLLEVSCTYQSPNTRWYSGAGIYRNVFFIEKDSSYIPNDGVYFSSENTEGNNFILHVDTELISKSNENGVLVHNLKDSSGNVVAAKEINVSLAENAIINKEEIIVTDARRWDIDDPYLYTLETSLYVENELSDFVSNNVGFRTIRFDSNEGFFLNGRNVKINGACQHHDLGALGAAVNKAAIRRQFEKLKKMGVNSVRTSHNMPANELMELADEMGILINSESFDMWERPKTTYDYSTFFPEWFAKDVKSWVRRDRNHPSVIIWSIGNEIFDTHAGDGLKWTRLLRDEVRANDYMHNAYTGIGSNYIEWEGAQKCSDELELSGYNYGERLYDDHHKKYPHWCIFGSETSSTVQSRGIYHFPLSKRMLTHDDGQCSAFENCTTNWGARDTGIVVAKHRDHDFVFGQYIWTGWDYIGEPTPYFSKNSYFGQIDTAGFEKDTFYHYQAEWTDVKTNPMVHICPYWDFNDGQLIDVCIYSNASLVELFVNGESKGKKTIDHLHDDYLMATWIVPYVPGEIKAVAYDENGNIIATDIQKSFSDAKKINLTPNKSTLLANPEDLIFVEIYTTDENGNYVANARNRMNVKVEGAASLVGLDNGDSTDYEEYKGSSRKLFSGKLLAILASNGKVGEIRLSVESEGLESAVLVLNSEKSDIKTGSVFMTPNYKSDIKKDIPVRKIALTNLGTNKLNEKVSETEVIYEVFPKNATYKDINVRALTYDGVEANFVTVSIEGNRAKVKAIGDGKFRLIASASNGSQLSEIISELEFEATGLGIATMNPYNLIPGIQYSSCSHEGSLSFTGGVFVPAETDSYLTYNMVDFGDFGSDTFTIPIFSFDDELPLSVWIGDKDSEECLGHFLYKAKSIYNTYQENTFTLSRRISGTQNVTFKFESKGRFSVKGFVFEEVKKAYSLLQATENSRVTGDSFVVSSDSISKIGNNVSIEYDKMDFAYGLKKIRLCGRSNNEITSIHILFMEGTESTKQMIEIPFSSSFEEYVFDLNDIHTNGSVSFVFLPGSNFDLKWFKFEK